jgi:ASC-1-like (ASCH) protein
MKYEKNLSEPWFSLIKIGKKTIEGRLNKGDFKELKKNDIIKFINNDFSIPRSFLVKIKSTKIYNSFNEYLTNEKLHRCLPGIDTIEEGVSIYYKYYKKSDEEQYKIIAIKFKVIKDKN